MHVPPSSLAAGRNIIRRYLETLPGTPGVYRMLDATGEALYVGKARNLKHRVSSYINVEAMNARLQRMIAQTASMEFTSTRSEAEALLLEGNLVRKLNPRYNILLKDDKSFPYIFFSGDDFSRIGKHRGAKTKKGKYYGPFVSAAAVNETITFLQKAFLLRPCSDTIFKNRTRPCLQYQIKRCSAPCVNKISKEQYGELVGQAQSFLSGKSREIQDALVAEMQELSLQMQYEKARVIRDRIRALTKVQQEGKLNTSLNDADIIGLARTEHQCAIVMLSVRGGQNYGSKTWMPREAEHYGDSEVLSAFITQHYQSQPAPGTIITSHMLEESTVLEEALRMHTDYKVEIIHPMRGEKRALAEVAVRNAKQALVRYFSMNVKHREALTQLQERFGLEDFPERIEIYDNSHISGTDAVGAMVVAGPEGPVKAEYRRFNIKRPETAPGDDYAMLREVLTRRFRRLQEGDEADARRIPSLVLIDGGAGQLSVAMQVFEELGVQGIPVAAIAKGPDRNAGREQFFLPGQEPFTLPQDSPLLHYLQRLRDEAHRFAIGGHRNKRSKTIRTSELDSVPLIGPGRKKALLLFFGSSKAVSNASIQDLEKVPGISKSMAKIIYSHFHGGEE